MVLTRTPDPIQPTRWGPDPDRPTGFFVEIFSRGVLSEGCIHGVNSGYLRKWKDAQSVCMHNC